MGSCCVVGTMKNAGIRHTQSNVCDESKQIENVPTFVEWDVVTMFPNRKHEGRMVDALVQKGDEGRGMAAISFGEVPSNR